MPRLGCRSLRPADEQDGDRRQPDTYDQAGEPQARGRTARRRAPFRWHSLAGQAPVEGDDLPRVTGAPKHDRPRPLGTRSLAVAGVLVETERHADAAGRTGGPADLEVAEQPVAVVGIRG